MKNDKIPRSHPLMRAATAPACPGWTPIGTLPPVVAPPSLPSGMPPLAPLRGLFNEPVIDPVIDPIEPIIEPIEPNIDPIVEPVSEPAPPLPADPILGRP